jgi:hypothetical protein
MLLSLRSRDQVFILSLKALRLKEVRTIRNYIKDKDETKTHRDT